MIVGILLASVSVIFYTLFGVLAQYFEVHPLDLILARCTIQGCLFSLILLNRGEAVAWSFSVIFAGFLAFVCNASFPIVLHVLPLGPSVILLHSTTGFTALFARLMAKERISMLKAICIASIFIGQVLVVQPAFLFEEFDGFDTSVGPQEYFGIAIGLLGGSSNALMLVFVALKKPSKDASLLTASIIGFVAALIVGIWIPGSQIFHGPVQGLPTVTGRSILVGTFAVLAFGSWTFSMGHCPSVLLSMISSSEVVTAFVSQIVIFHQTVNILQGIGAALVLVTVLIAISIDDQNQSIMSGYVDLESEVKPTEKK